METNVLYKLSKFRNVLLPTFYSPPPAARAFAVAFTHHRHWPLKNLHRYLLNLMSSLKVKPL